MLVDMHNHTKVSSPCSLLSATQLIERALLMGLDAICVTEHFCLEGAERAQEVGRKLGFPVFRGIGARSDVGDVLVYGYYKDIPEGIPHDELLARVHEAPGVAFVAHPFRDQGIDLVTGAKRLGWDLESGWHRILFLKNLGGVETLNGQMPDPVNHKAAALARKLGLPGIGGSDSHSLDMVGKAATRFNGHISNEPQLVAELRKGSYEAVRLPHYFDASQKLTVGLT